MENKLCYICSPYRGDTERNTQYAQELTRRAVLKGYTPITPHLYITQALDDADPAERAPGMEAGLHLLEPCKYIMIGGRYGLSEGMRHEIERAHRLGKTFLYEDQLRAIAQAAYENMMKGAAEAQQPQETAQAASTARYYEIGQRKYAEASTVVINVPGPAAGAPGVAVATDNVPEGALEPNPDGSVNAYDEAGLKVGTVDAATAEAAAEGAQNAPQTAKDGQQEHDNT